MKMENRKSIGFTEEIHPVVFLHLSMSIQSVSIQSRSIQFRSNRLEFLLSQLLQLPLQFSPLFLVLFGLTTSVQAQSLETTRYQYPEPIVTSFVKTCTEEASELPTAVKSRLCVCLVTEYQNQYSFQAFQSIGRLVQLGKPMPKEMTQVITHCVERAMLKQV
jgi:hypothetical protein